METGKEGGEVSHNLYSRERSERSERAMNRPLSASKLSSAVAAPSANHPDRRRLPAAQESQGLVRGHGGARAVGGTPHQRTLCDARDDDTQHAQLGVDADADVLLGAEGQCACAGGESGESGSLTA